MQNALTCAGTQEKGPGCIRCLVCLFCSAHCCFWLQQTQLVTLCRGLKLLLTSEAAASLCLGMIAGDVDLVQL